MYLYSHDTFQPFVSNTHSVQTLRDSIPYDLHRRRTTTGTKIRKGGKILLKGFIVRFVLLGNKFQKTTGEGEMMSRFGFVKAYRVSRGVSDWRRKESPQLSIVRGVIMGREFSFFCTFQGFIRN